MVAPPSFGGDGGFDLPIADFRLTTLGQGLDWGGVGGRERGGIEVRISERGRGVLVIARLVETSLS